MRRRLDVLTGAPAKPAGPAGPVSPRSPCRGQMVSQIQGRHQGCALRNGETYRGTARSSGSSHSNRAGLTLPAEQELTFWTLCVGRPSVTSSPTYPLTLRSGRSRQTNSTSQTTGSVLARSSIASLGTSLSLKGATCLGKTEPELSVTTLLQTLGGTAGIMEQLGTYATWSV